MEVRGPCCAAGRATMRLAVYGKFSYKGKHHQIASTYTLRTAFSFSSSSFFFCFSWFSFLRAFSLRALRVHGTETHNLASLGLMSLLT